MKAAAHLWLFFQWDWHHGLWLSPAIEPKWIPREKPKEEALQSYFTHCYTPLLKIREWIFSFLIIFNCSGYPVFLSISSRSAGKSKWSRWSWQPLIIILPGCQSVLSLHSEELIAFVLGHYIKTPGRHVLLYYRECKLLQMTVPCFEIKWEFKM